MTNELNDLVAQIKAKKEEFDAKDSEYAGKFAEVFRMVDKVVSETNSMNCEYDELTSAIFEKIVTVGYDDVEQEDKRDQQFYEYHKLLKDNDIATYTNYGSWLPSSYKC